ncbi:MAG TPA: hypothetical protein VFB12_24785 [Ktedonobacteraceae bacterium]|nr:hypothetical protein [Ktedonobacteraceae bacterium]
MGETLLNPWAVKQAGVQIHCVSLARNEGKTMNELTNLQNRVNIFLTVPMKQPSAQAVTGQCFSAFDPVQMRRVR